MHYSNEYLEEHIDQARLLFFNNLSHSGVPVHPLQFQRYIRNMGVDHDCHIIVYDKGEQIWSSYAFWIFKLFGHEKISLLNGGFPEWKRLQLAQAGPYPTALGSGPFLDYVGDFQARWTSDYISAFDDVLANFDHNNYDLVDAQSPEEFDGIVPGAIYGHIQGAINIPPEEVFDATNNTWLENSETAQIFVSNGLHEIRPVIVYCGTSLHASMLWFALHRLKYNATIYFGSWPEWIIRAPDNLKVIPKQNENLFLPTSKENLRYSTNSNETFVTQKMKKQQQ
uniref:Rhodanese domain-containing protein n=1 Tax=Panagrolaimus superbus TaxID=310955 RepID=A0A914Z102_9BILA